jgi:hypothetical protein
LPTRQSLPQCDHADIIAKLPKVKDAAAFDLREMAGHLLNPCRCNTTPQR